MVMCFSHLHHQAIAAVHQAVCEEKSVTCHNGCAWVCLTIALKTLNMYTCQSVHSTMTGNTKHKLVLKQRCVQVTTAD